MKKMITNGELKSASLSQLKSYCDELREQIFDTVSVCGGHLASNLGAVELTVALHRVFHFPKDKLIFDVGHQCYTHKLLSDRFEQFSTLRQRGGLSGFPKREESEYDSYNTGHAGTAISAALGISKARDLKGEQFYVIAVVGDGAFQNGLVYEALNSIKILQSRILIILNDNGMSISPTVGGMHEILERIRADQKSDVQIFERFGLQYRGVYDGNQLEELIPALQESKTLLDTSSVLLHVVTQKGKGYPFCEGAPTQTHGVSPVMPKKEYSTALGEELCALAEKNSNIVAVTAAMTDNLGLRNFFDQFPNRAFDVGICEEHACVLCSSMATAGLKPYFVIYSTFLERAFDEIIHDICCQNLPVTICIDRAGVSGADGETHQGVFDLSFLSFIPNLSIGIPKDIGEFRAMLRLSEKCSTPFAIRYPRAGTEGEISVIEMGKFEVLHSTMSDVVVFAAGERCIKIAKELQILANQDGIDFSLINARFLRPLDKELLASIKQKHIITLEDNALIGGLGDAVTRFYREQGIEKTIKCFGLSDRFIPHGEPQKLMEEFGLCKERILNAIRSAYEGG